MPHMHAISSWATDDRKVLLHFDKPALRIFSSYVQHEDTDCEAGGILLGSVHGNHLLIEQATVPTERDKRFRYLFERMPFGHDAIALTRWKESQGTIRYLGEWHTHPEDDPTPSHLDRSEWSRLSSIRRDERPLLVVIVGRASLYTALVSASGEAQVLLPID